MLLESDLSQVTAISRLRARVQPLRIASPMGSSLPVHQPKHSSTQDRYGN